MNNNNKIYKSEVLNKNDFNINGKAKNYSIIIIKKKIKKK